MLRADHTGALLALRIFARSVWTCVGALAILERLDVVDLDSCSWWLCERQLPNGGLNGRPEKLEDASAHLICHIGGSSNTILTIVCLVHRFVTVGG